MQRFKMGDRVMSPFTINCGACFYCRRGLTSRWVPLRGTFGVELYFEGLIDSPAASCAGVGSLSCLAGWGAGRACMAHKRSTSGETRLADRQPCAVP